MGLRSWVLLLVAVLLVVGLIAYARGTDHHRGDDVGALGEGTAAGSAVGAGG